MLRPALEPAHGSSNKFSHKFAHALASVSATPDGVGDAAAAGAGTARTVARWTRDWNVRESASALGSPENAVHGALASVAPCEAAQRPGPTLARPAEVPLGSVPARPSRNESAAVLAVAANAWESTQAGGPPAVCPMPALAQGWCPAGKLVAPSRTGRAAAAAGSHHRAESCQHAILHYQLLPLPQLELALPMG